MDKTYQPDQIEKQWREAWEERGYFQPQSGTSNYSIVLPPPNVTGTLHMGHGFQHTLMDALIRRARMQNQKTLWQPGTDHAGIATQMVVERQLAKENKSRHDIGREAFIEKVWDWKEQSGNTITRQMRRLGTSPDWSREQFSMDEGITHATYHAFIKLYEDKLIYRGKRLVNWDPKLHTAISDLEVENEQKEGHLWHIRYPLSDGSCELVVATTRPETMLGDTAVAVHPDDDRYKALIGKMIKLPLTDREIPIIADDYVDKDFGTGCVKITPAHDFNDYEMGKRHNLPMINIMDLNAHLNNNVPNEYQNLERFEARKKIVGDLEKANLLEKIEQHTISVPKGDRSGAIIEPLLTDQWYVKTDTLAKAAMDVVDRGDLKFVPDNWTKTYMQWLENIQDWCISRQLWWGHRIPVWYDDAGNHFVGFDEADARKRNKLSDDIKLTQDNDVLDTWFTAALWPFSSLGWPEKTEALKDFYPTDVMVTGFDIIFFWVARMVMMGLYFMKDVPFKEVYITGLIRDSHGHKMSKTKGNVLDPIDIIDGIELAPLIEKRCAGLMQPQMIKSIEKNTKNEFPDGIAAHGTDAVRFTYCALASTGRDINFDMGRVDGYRNFCNKLWNAARFVIMNTEEHDLNAEGAEYSLTDQWIREQLQLTINKVNNAFAEYRFDLIAQLLYEFTWNQYCDWYLEFTKCVLNNDAASDAAKRGTRYTLLDILETLLRLLHPLIPYISEEIWQKVAPMIGRGSDSIMKQPYPENLENINENTLQEIDWLKQFITHIRNIRGEMNVAPSKPLTIILSKGNETDKQRLQHCESYIKTLAKVSEMTWQDDNLPASATALLGDLELHIPLAGLIDKDSELARLKKEMQKLEKDAEKFKNKLNNENYVSKAPAAVVEKERQRLQEAENALKKLQEHYQRIDSL